MCGGGESGWLTAEGKIWYNVARKPKTGFQKGKVLMGSSGGMSQSEIYESQKKAKEDAAAEAEAKQKAEQEQAQAAAQSGAKGSVGGGADSYEGALSSLKAKKSKRGSTLSGEGEATFSEKTGKLGE